MLHIHALMSLLLVGQAPDTPRNAIPSALASSPAEPRTAGPPMSLNIPLFRPKEFPFVTTRPDDGTDVGGGWQVAKVNLEFVRVIIPTDVKVWHCRLNIEMPLRSEKWGKVDAKRAAQMSAKVANAVAADIDHSLPQGVFCHKFFLGMETKFPAMYPKLGERITK